MLQSVGYQVDSCANGVEALEMCGHSKYALVLTDLLMPHMGGIELSKRLSAQDPSLPIVLMTAEPPDSAHLPEAVTQPIIWKPCHLQELARVIRQELDK